MSESYEQLKKFPRDLPVMLNETELDKYGEQLAVAVKEVELLQDKKKQETAKWANLIKAKDLEVKRLADARAKGEEMRPVICVERLVGNVVQIIRLDTLAVVDSRPADLTELQTTIPGTDEPPTPGKRETSGGTVISLVPNIDPGDPIVPHASEAADSDDPLADHLLAENERETQDMLDSAANSEAGAPVESSTGDQVFVGGDLQCHLCDKPITDEDQREEAEGRIVHTGCLVTPGDSAEDTGERSKTLSNGMTVKLGDQQKYKAKRERSSRKNSDKKGKK